MEVGDGTGTTGLPTKKPQGGCRCVLGGCSNMYDGYRMHEMTKVGAPGRFGWIQFIQTTVKGFQPIKRGKIYLCNGHFE